jgi:hypothetical protein
MCVVKKSYLQECWRTDPTIKTNYVKSIGMSQDKHITILAVLHANKN